MERERKILAHKEGETNEYKKPQSLTCDFSANYAWITMQ